MKRFGPGRLADASPGEVLNQLADAQELGKPYVTNDLTKKE